MTINLIYWYIVFAQIPVEDFSSPAKAPVKSEADSKDLGALNIDKIENAQQVSRQFFP